MNPNDPFNQSPQNQNTNPPQPDGAFVSNAQQSTVQPQQPAPFNDSTMPPMMNAQPPRRGRKGMIVVLLVVIIAVAVGAYFLTKKPSPGSNGSSGSTGTSSGKLASQLQLLAGKGNKLQPGDLSKFDKTALFYAVFKNAAEQNVVTTIADHYEGGNATDQSSRALEFLYNTTFNYKTKALAQEIQDPAGDYTVRCVNGKNYTYDGVNTMSWQAETPPTDSCTDPLSYDGSINDGINTGGLTASQAQAFVDGLASTQGLLSIDSISLATHDNAPYIRFAVTIHPVKVADGSYQGMGRVGYAFNKTGIDALSWPYQPFGSIATGAKLVYYVNPATQLPAYSQIAPTYYVNDSGKQQPNNTYTFLDTQYAFGGSVQPLSLTGAPASIKISWKEEPMQ